MEIELLQAKTVIDQQKAVNVGANAQLVLRDLHLQELQGQIFQLKATKKPSSRRKLMSTKMARHLTGKEFRNALRQMADEDAAKAEQRKVNETERDLGKRRKEWRVQEQELRKAAQKAALAAWEKRMEAAALRGLKKKPQKPKVTVLYPRADTPDHLKSSKKRSADQAKTRKDVDDDSSESESHNSEEE